MPPTPPNSRTLEADVEGHPGQGGVDDVAQIHLLFLIKIQFPPSAAGEAERDELLGMEPVQGLGNGEKKTNEISLDFWEISLDFGEVSLNFRGVFPQFLRGFPPFWMRFPQF